MSKQTAGIVVILGIIAAIIIGHRFVSKQTKTRIEKKQKVAFRQREMAQEVACDECGAVSRLSVLYPERRKFQKCPACGAQRARPIVYFMCLNPDCNRQLVRFRNKVMEGSIFHQSPDGSPVCPSCGQPDMMEPQELSIKRAKSIAAETGQEFP